MFWKTIALSLCALVIWGLLKVRAKRRELDGCPMPPMPYGKLLGHIPIMAKAVGLFPKDVHVQQVCHYISKKYDMGPVWYLDLWPAGPRFCFISDPVIASQYVTTGQSLHKYKGVKDYLDVFLGSNNIVVAEGEHWKSLRSIFNPGFNAAHIMTLVPYMVESTEIYINILLEKARTNELFELEEVSTRLTIDIIGKVVLDTDFNSQRIRHPLVSAFRDRTGYMHNGARVFEFLNNLEFRRLWKLRQNGKTLDRCIELEIDKALSKRGKTTTKSTSFKDRKRSIIDLAMDAYQDEKLSSSTSAIKPDPASDKVFRLEATNAVKTFLFAGHDTTSSTLAYCLYLLHHHPDVRAEIVQELKSVYGPDLSPSTLGPSIIANPHTTNSLPYLTAVIRETLRLFPPASTLRETPYRNTSLPNPSPTATFPRTQLPLSLHPEGITVWPLALIVHRNPLYFPSPSSFIPARFLPDRTPFPDAKLFSPDNSGKDAFRAFEKGPRACIGEQFAMIETRVILAMVIGAGINFRAELGGKEAEGKGGVDMVQGTDEWEERMSKGEVKRQQAEGRVVEGYEVYQMLKGAGKPSYLMPGRCYVR
jgi:cytochrome P450